MRPSISNRDIHFIQELGLSLAEIARNRGVGTSAAVIFIDEFEELAGRRDNADRLEKSITNEFLKQVPQFKNEANRVLLVCATNYIQHLDAALLRPGRFDCIIPVGGLNEDDGNNLSYHVKSSAVSNR